MKKIAIIGAGPAGSTVAYVLSKHLSTNPLSIDVYEANAFVGGMAASIELWDQKVDFGPHRFFSYDPEVNQLWDECVQDNYAWVRRKTRIYYKGKFFYYPIEALDVLFKLSPLETLNALGSYTIEKIHPTRDLDTFEGWMIHHFGKKLYKTFFKTYTEKLWGIPSHELDADFAKQRIKKFSLSEAIKSALFPSTRKKHKTLAEQFKYPLHGSGQVYEYMMNSVTKNGVNLYLNTPVEKIIIENNQLKGILLPNNHFVPYDYVVSSMPLTSVVQQIEDAPSHVKAANKKLYFRNTILVYLLLNTENIFDDQWIYVHDPHLTCGRITNFRNWVPTLYGKSHHTILALEYWCFDDDPLWKEDDKKLIQLASEDLIKTKLIDFSKILDGKVFRLHRSYPVYFSGYKQVLEPIVNYLKTLPQVLCIGRYGSYKYNNQDHSILMGIKAAENILFERKHNLWEINSDYDTYLESKMIENHE